MDLNGALQGVLKKALIHDGVARGLRECVKALDRRQAHLCILAQDCDSAEYVRLVEALAQEHSIDIIKVADGKQLGEWVFGCDICQDVCPWNRRHAKRHSEERLEPRPGVLEMSRADWVDLTEETFREVFKSTPLKRTGWEGIRRNLGLA